MKEAWIIEHGVADVVGHPTIAAGGSGARRALDGL
jgi:hypothetical protein